MVNKKKVALLAGILVVCLFVLTGCYAGSDVFTQKEAGFFYGLLHG